MQQSLSWLIHLFILGRIPLTSIRPNREALVFFSDRPTSEPVFSMIWPIGPFPGHELFLVPDLYRTFLPLSHFWPQSPQILWSTYIFTTMANVLNRSSEMHKTCSHGSKHQILKSTLWFTEFSCHCHWLSHPQRLKQSIMIGENCHTFCLVLLFS